ncbi:hypothetical protein L9F63_011416 [Diploptera punctata]|uniref:Major facilitator superfamily (MFS) profile domain-containing protein n=1 Tax=Diploptera punctata TaxID=6984 RepID=A0AAD8AFI0_DIPPU|nr:hypothetical protein L9F63_011416 [Diploptera punctata]
MGTLSSIFSSRRLPQYLAAIIANLASIAYGVVAGWSSPSLPLLKSNDTAIGEPISVEDETWLGSVIHLSALLSSPIYSYINQNWGRKLAGYNTAIPLIIGWLLIIFAHSVIHLYIARILMGLTMSGVNVFVVMYVGEISEDSVRGALGSIRGLSADVGILFAYGIGPYLSVRHMGIICIIMPLLFVVLFFWLPESPMFLLGKGKAQEALNSYKWLRGGDEQIAEEEIRKLSVVVTKVSKKVTITELISVRGTRNALIIAIVFSIVIQFSGMYVIASYASILFEQSGSTIPSDIAAIIIGVFTIIGSALSIIGSELAGRRIILISTQIIESLSLSGLAIYLLLKEIGIDVSPVGILPVIFISAYCLCIAAGVATLGYVVISEIFRPEARGLAMSVTSSLVWGLAFVITKFHHSLESSIQLYGCFFVYSGVALLGAIFTYIRVPETKNRSLDSILRELNGDASVNG